MKLLFTSIMASSLIYFVFFFPFTLEWWQKKDGVYHHKVIVKDGFKVTYFLNGSEKELLGGGK